MVLVDTSVWIRFLAGKEPLGSELDRLLADDGVLGHELVYGELLIGDRGRRERWLAAYAAMRWAESVAHQEVVQLVVDRGLKGAGIGWIDNSDLLINGSMPRQLWQASYPGNAVSRITNDLSSYAGVSLTADRATVW